MATKKYVVLADIESIRVPFGVFAAALEELSNFGEVAVCKFYGYSAKRTKDYGEFIQENSYDALSALPKKRKGKLDLRQVIDAARLAQFPNIDGFFLIYGKGDITPLMFPAKSWKNPKSPLLPKLLRSNPRHSLRHNLRQQRPVRKTHSSRCSCSSSTRLLRAPTNNRLMLV